MKSTFFVAALVGTAAAYPKNAMKDLVAAIAKRGGWQGSTELWGEWKSGADLGQYGEDIKEIIMGKGTGTSSVGYKAPAMDSDECKEDECCIWKYITEDLYENMRDGDGCNDFARAAIRMGFHDASAWDADSTWGGADGSLLLDGTDELTRFENGGGIGIQAPVMKGFYEKYQSYGISMADLIQAGSKVGVLACPGGPRIRMWVGREDDATAAPTGRLPPAAGDGSDADSLIELFAKKTVSPGGLIALLGAHTASRNHIPFLGAENPQDLTPGKWDTAYFKETLQTDASTNVTRFPSDTNLAQSDKTKDAFEFFNDNLAAWNEAYAKEYVRMSMFGVKKISKLVECSKAMPKGKIPDGGDNDYPNSSTKYPGGHSTTGKYPKPTSTKGHGGNDDDSYTTKSHGGHGDDGYTTTKGHGGHGGDSYTTKKPKYTTSTIYTKSTITLYSCAPQVTNCPYDSKNPHVTYSEYPVSTTICEVTYTDEAEYPEKTYSPVVSAEYTEAAPAYPSASEGYDSPVDTSKSGPVVVSGAGRIVGGLLAAAAGVLFAL